jgi:hypothetical protein
MNNRDQHGHGAEGGQHRGGGHLAVLPQVLAGLLLLSGLSPSALWAQTNAAKAAPSSRRWLLVVETSKSMQRRADAVLGAVRGMLASDLNGQLEAGDTLGMWTFNEDLYAGRFPLQTWSPQARVDIMERTLAFLKAQKYENQCRFDKVAPALSRVIKDSELITVILISSGDGKVQGTAIDGRINEYYNQWRKQQQNAGIPFVIVLRTKSGQLADYSLNTAPWPVELPRLASEMRSAATTPERFPEAALKTPPPAVPPLIISVKKPLPEQAPTPKPEPAIAKAEAPPTLDAAAITNETVKAKPPEPAAPPVEVAKTGPPPTAEAATIPNKLAKAEPPEPAAPPVELAKAESPPTLKVATTPNEPVKAKPLEPAAPPVEVAKAEPPPTVDVAASPNEPAKAKPPEPAALPVEVAKTEPPPAVPDMPATQSAPKPAPAPTPVAQPKEEIASAPEAKPVEPAPAKPEPTPPPPTPTSKPEPVTMNPPKPSPAPQMTTGPAPAAAPVHEDAPSAAAIAVATQPVPSATSSLAPRPTSLPTSPVQNAAAVPAGTLTSHLNLWIAGLVLAVVAAVSALLLKRRSHAVPQGSLITRSFEREKKP